MYDYAVCSNKNYMKFDAAIYDSRNGKKVFCARGFNSEDDAEKAGRNLKGLIRQIEDENSFPLSAEELRKLVEKRSQVHISD